MKATAELESNFRPAAVAATRSDVPVPDARGIGLFLAQAGLCVGLLLATMAAYHSGMYGPFVLDDEPSIVANDSIRQLWPISGPLTPPSGGGLTVEGRPILNLTLAFNYALSGLNPAAFRLTNLFIHIASGLLLFGLVWQTLIQNRRAATAGGQAAPSFSPWQATFAAGVVAAIWLLHPLATAAVTYIIQRAESLCAFFFLLTLFGFAYGTERGSTAVAARVWLTISVVACLLGMATKETMAAAPLLVLLCDRAFVAGTFAGAWRSRRGYYLALASTWMLLAALVAGFGGRGGSAGFSAGISSWHYLLTQAPALVRYALLAAWPNALVFDYGTELVTHVRDAFWPGLVVVSAFVMALVALRKWPRIGFVAMAVFALLAPSSSFVPVATQTMAEHRMYLPLAGLIVLAGCALWSLFGRYAIVLGGVAAVVAGGATMQRNLTYRDPVNLWQDTVAKRPDNTRARNNLALLLRERGRPAEALVHIDAALAREPGSVAIHNNRATVLSDLRRFDEAVLEIDGVLRAVPALPEALDTKAEILRAMGRHQEAATYYAEAVRLKPTLARATAAAPASP